MIYFKVDVGYYVGDVRPKNLDSITITDADVYYPIGTIYNVAFPGGNKNQAKFQEACATSFDEDFYKIGLLPATDRDYSFAVRNNNWVQWAGFMYPNLYAEFEKSPAEYPNIKFAVFIFRQLGYLVRGNGYPEPDCSIYRINDDSTLTYLNSEIGANFTQQAFNFGFIANYTTDMDLSQANNYRLSAYVNTSTERNSFVANNNPFLKFILSTNPKPDKVDPAPDNPYGPGGDTEPGGGGGDFDDTTTPIDFPPLPTVSAADTGFISLFNPTTAQLQELSSYMWSDLFDVEGWKKIFANPMDAVLGLSLVPVAVPGGGSRPVKVGNISTGVSLTVAATQYVTVDCGTINVNEYWGGYLDYDPYTKAEIYLPYIGTHAMAVDDIMGKSVHVVYHVDILSGACCAYVKCGESVLYSFVGQCSCSIPITGSDWTNVINGALSIAGAIGSMVATGGASAPMAVGTMASAAVNSLKPNVEKSGSMGGMGGMLGIQIPYLILTRPRQALPSNQSHYTGYPSFITVKLGDCQGYTEIESVHLEGVPATQAEISEIETLLKGGVIF